MTKRRTRCGWRSAWWSSWCRFTASAGSSWIPCCAGWRKPGQAPPSPCSSPRCSPRGSRCGSTKTGLPVLGHGPAAGTVRPGRTCSLGCWAAPAPRVVTLGPPLLVGAAHIKINQPPDAGGLALALFCVAAGSIGEELFFRGYGFQILLANAGPWAAILPVGVAFGLMHLRNPSSSPLGAGEYRGFRHSFRLRLPAQPRPVAAHRPALWLEFYIAHVWSQPERDYNI